MRDRHRQALMDATKKVINPRDPSFSLQQPLDLEPSLGVKSGRLLTRATRKRRWRVLVNWRTPGPR
jgi:hypothetical protein